MRTLKADFQNPVAVPCVPTRNTGRQARARPTRTGCAGLPIRIQPPHAASLHDLAVGSYVARDEADITALSTLRMPKANAARFIFSGQPEQIAGAIYCAEVKGAGL